MEVDLDGARIVIVMMSAIGDVVHVLPVLNALKRHAPSCHITWVLKPVPAMLVRGHPLVDEIVEFNPGHGGRAYIEAATRKGRKLAFHQWRTQIREEQGPIDGLRISLSTAITKRERSRRCRAEGGGAACLSSESTMFSKSWRSGECGTQLLTRPFPIHMSKSPFQPGSAACLALFTPRVELSSALSLSLLPPAPTTA